MIISAVEPFVVAVPPRRKHPMAFGGADLGQYVIVQLTTADGIVGFGEATVLAQWGGDHARYYGEVPSTTVALIRDILAPAIVGLDAMDIETLHIVMDRALRGYPYAKSAIDIAAHDAKGKALNVPVYQLLGGLARPEVHVAHSLGILEPEVLKAEAAQAIEDGVRTIKIKIGLDPERDVNAVRDVRNTVGDGPRLVVDANQGYRSPKIAIKALRQMEEYGIYYAEQPVEGLREMAEVREHVDVLVMADESAWTARDVLDIAMLGSADLVSLYTTKPGGLSGAKKAAAVAEAAGLMCNVNGSSETGVGNAANLHLAASTAVIDQDCLIPVTTLAGREQAKVAGVYFTDDIITEPFKLIDGKLQVPDGPGLGIELDPEKLDRYRVN